MGTEGALAAFTGTRKGMTRPQRERVLEALEALLPRRVAHGCAMGADRQVHKLLGGLALREARWPGGIPADLWPSTPEQVIWAERNQRARDHLLDPAPALTRNRHMVDGATIVLAAPAERGMQSRGGTWATVRYALRQGKEIRLFWPDGTSTTIGACPPGHPERVAFEAALTRAAGPRP